MPEYVLTEVGKQIGKKKDVSERSDIETIIQILVYLGARSWSGVNVKGERVGEGVND